MRVRHAEHLQLRQRHLRQRAWPAPASRSASTAGAATAWPSRRFPEPGRTWRSNARGRLSSAIVLAGRPRRVRQHRLQTVTQASPAARRTLPACQQLRADMVRNGGTPDLPTLKYVAAHVTSPKVIKDAQLAVSNTKQDPGNSARIRARGGSADVRLQQGGGTASRVRLGPAGSPEPRCARRGGP